MAAPEKLVIGRSETLESPRIESFRMGEFYVQSGPTDQRQRGFSN